MNIQTSTSSPAFNLANLFKSLNVRSASITLAQVNISTDAPAEPSTTPPASTTATPAVTPPVATTTTTPTQPAPQSTTTTTPTRPADTTDISREARDRCECERGDDKRREAPGLSPERLIRLADKFSSRAERLEAKAAKLQEEGGDSERIDKLNRRAERYWKLAEKFASMVPGGDDTAEAPTPAPAPTPTPAPAPAPAPAVKSGNDNATLAPATTTPKQIDLVA